MISRETVVEFCGVSHDYLRALEDACASTREPFEERVKNRTEAIRRTVDHELQVIREIINQRVSSTSTSADEAPTALVNLRDVLNRFTKATAPAWVYFLVHKGIVVYVGQTVGISTRIRAHEREKEKVFDDVWTMPVDRKKLDDTEDFFIRLFDPKYNVAGSVTNKPMRTNKQRDASNAQVPVSCL